MKRFVIILLALISAPIYGQVANLGGGLGIQNISNVDKTGITRETETVVTGTQIALTPGKYKIDFGCDAAGGYSSAPSLILMSTSLYENPSTVLNTCSSSLIVGVASNGGAALNEFRGSCSKSYEYTTATSKTVELRFRLNGVSGTFTTIQAKRCYISAIRIGN